MITGLVFNEQLHTYHLDGVRLPSVTGILGIINEPGLNAWRGRVGNEEADRVMHASADFGTRVHAACEKLATASHLDYLGTFEPDVHPFAEAFNIWLSGNVREVLGCETRVASAQHGYAGSLDLCAMLMDGSSAIIDIKTSKGNYPHPKWGAQLAAYQVALLESAGIVTTRRLIVQMPSDRPGELIVHERPISEARTDWNAFLAALTLYRWVQAAEPVRSAQGKLRPARSVGALARPVPIASQGARL